ncbi:rhodanese-like domain-containing protein [soil metagenome]
MKQHATHFLNLVQEARNQIKETNVAEVKTKLDKQDDFYLGDVREESEWQGGHLPKALHLSKGIIERDIENKIPDNNATIILYCGGGFRSALAAYNLQKMGYKNVISMMGGFRGWKEAGFEVV